jgi:hypothetical protein
MFLAERYGGSFGSWVSWILRGSESVASKDGLVLLLSPDNCALVAQAEVQGAQAEGFSVWGVLR